MSDRLELGRRQFFAQSAGVALVVGAGGAAAADVPDAGCPPPTTVPTTASLTQLDGMTAADWALLQAARDSQATVVADVVLELLKNLTGVFIGFGVDQLTHVLQTATRARRANASDELV